MFKRVLITIAFLLLASIPYQAVYAETICPSTMDPNSVECLDYMRDKLADIKTKQSALDKSLSNEQYQQLSLEEKIKYINSQISSTQVEIETLELEIASKDVEIKLLNDEITEKEDYLSVLKQEADMLKNTVNRRVTESYKFSFVGPFELFLDSKNIDTVLRKTKYLLDTREQDKQSLEEYNLKAESVEAEEVVLAEKKADLQSKRNEVEEEKSSLVEERTNLSSQKAEKDRLLAESEKREKEMIAQMDYYRTQQASIDNAIMVYLAENGDQMANYGWVSKGTWIGRLHNGASSGCSTGTHLHFSIDKMSTKGTIGNGCGMVNTFSGYLVKGPDYWLRSGSWYYYYIHSGSMRVPLGGSVILTGLTHYPWSNYCPGPRYPIDISSTIWYDIPVYAAHEGNLWKGTDRCGDTYAVIENPSTGIRTAYFHMQ